MCFTVKHFPFLKWALGLGLFMGPGMENSCGWARFSTEKFLVFLWRCPLLSGERFSEGFDGCGLALPRLGSSFRIKSPVFLCKRELMVGEGGAWFEFCPGLRAPCEG